MSCSSAQNCIQCASGYTLSIDTTNNNNYVCVQCINNCRNCAKGQPANCLDCGDGAYLASDFCNLCSPYCQTCSQLGCSQCYTGYKLNDDLLCSQLCQYPCANCFSSPTSCLTCAFGYTLNNTSSSCIPSTSCNGSCVYCPDGYANNNG